MISPVIFSIFWNFDFLGCYGGIRAKNSPKWQTILFFMPHISETINHMIVINGTLVWNDNNSTHFFYFFKILIFQVVWGIKGLKMIQNDKKFCLTCSMSQEPYIIWLSCMVHMCKMIISPVGFIIFSKFWLSGSIGV